VLPSGWHQLGGPMLRHPLGDNRHPLSWPPIPPVQPFPPVLDLSVPRASAFLLGRGVGSLKAVAYIDLRSGRIFTTNRLNFFRELGVGRSDLGMLQDVSNVESVDLSLLPEGFGHMAVVITLINGELVLYLRPGGKLFWPMPEEQPFRNKMRGSAAIAASLHFYASLFHGSKPEGRRILWDLIQRNKMDKFYEEWKDALGNPQALSDLRKKWAKFI
jgi:hypothetical protein